MSFTLQKRWLDSLREHVANGSDSAILALIQPLHPADMAAVLDRLDADSARYVYRLLGAGTAADVLLEMDEGRREHLLESLTSREIAEEVLEHIDSDDAADVVGDLSEEKAREVLAYLEDPEQKQDIAELLRYEEGTAGALMAKELVKVKAEWSVVKAIVEMRGQAQEVEHVYTVYVVDKDDRFYGLLPLKDLLFSAESTRTLIKHLCHTDVASIRVDELAKEAVARMKRYDVAVLPVLDANGALLGRITFDDVMDVMEEEAEEDYQLASGITEDVDSMDSPFVQMRARLPWLLIGLAGGILSSQIIAMYEEELRIDPKMAFFMPLIAATAGNVGVQSSAIVVQGLAAKTLESVNIAGRLWKETRVGLLNAFICGTLIFLVNLLVRQSAALSYTVSIALFTVILTAAFFGTLIPLALSKFKVDPALATGPFVTTLNDIFGLLTYFSVGHLMYGYFA
jgi:magnesium transporter